MGCDGFQFCSDLRVANFNPRTHRGVRHRLHITYFNNLAISIHAPIVGCDYISTGTTLSFFNFNPRTHRGVRQSSLGVEMVQLWISIHAPIVGCDISFQKTLKVQTQISIHAPIVGCDGYMYAQRELGSEFQSTHPSWGATIVVSCII